MTTDASWPAWIPTDPPTLERMLAFDVQPIPVLPTIAAVLALGYVVGRVRLARIGRRWPWWRTTLFLIGCALLAGITGLGVEGYGFELLSVFMTQQMTIMIVVPPLLILGAPGTLLLAALPRTAAWRLVRVAAVSGLRARWARFLLHPGFAVPLFLVTFYGLYFSGLADGLLASWGGHVGLEVAFLVAGLLFTIPLISPDPLPRRDTHMMKLLDVFAEAAVHAMFGAIVMMATAPFLTTFANPPASWGIDPLADQRVAGGVAWGYGEGPTVALLMILAALWYNDDTRRARARDVRVDRDGDVELDAYNDYLRGLRQPD